MGSWVRHVTVTRHFYGRIRLMNASRLALFVGAVTSQRTVMANPALAFWEYLD